MKTPMPSRFKMGAGFYDKTFQKFYNSIDYPAEWIEQGKKYAEDDAYVISHPTWFYEPMPPAPMISIYQLFHQTAEKHSNQTAVIFLDKKISYQELDQLIGRYAAEFATEFRPL